MRAKLTSTSPCDNLAIPGHFLLDCPRSQYDLTHDTTLHPATARVYPNIDSTRSTRLTALLRQTSMVFQSEVISQLFKLFTAVHAARGRASKAYCYKLTGLSFPTIRGAPEHHGADR